MKKRNFSRIIFSMLVLAIGLSAVFAFKNPDQPSANSSKLRITAPMLTPPGPGFPKAAIAGSNLYDQNNNIIWRCGDDITVFTVNSTDNLTTGTTIYMDSHLINLVPVCVITSNTSPTVNSTFYVGWGLFPVVGAGVIGGPATPC